MNSHSDLAGHYLESCKLMPEETYYAVFVEAFPNIDYLTCVVYNFVENNFLTTTLHALISFKLLKGISSYGSKKHTRLGPSYLPGYTTTEQDSSIFLARSFHYSAKSFPPVCTGDDCYNLSGSGQVNSQRKSTPSCQLTGVPR